MANWLIIGATVMVFGLQVSESLGRFHPGAAPTEIRSKGLEPRQEPTDPISRETYPGRHWRTETFVLDAVSVKGLFGHMWLHAGLLHLAGNMLFLWVFGNAVCSKLGSALYVVLYVLVGVSAGLVFLVSADGAAVGASGAVSGVIGMYLVLFAQNRITCIWMVPFLYGVRFSVRSFWMILLWITWNVVGGICWIDTSRVAYTAHLGGFITGFSIVWLACHRRWIRAERGEGTLLQLMGRQTPPPEPDPPLPDYDPYPRTVPRAEAPLPSLRLDLGGHVPSTKTTGQIADATIRFRCPCGKRLKASIRRAGRRGVCPQCHRSITVPELI